MFVYNSFFLLALFCFYPNARREEKKKNISATEQNTLKNVRVLGALLVCQFARFTFVLLSERPPRLKPYRERMMFYNRF